MRLPGFRANSVTKRRAGFNAVPVVTLMCLILLALLAVAQVAHLHTTDSDADHCPLCIVMHSAAPVAIAAMAVVLVQIGMQTPPVEERRAIRHWHPTLYTRPPPRSLQG
jgi:TRAP-type C4-dicarboxylate transport system permease small subunit